MKWNYTEPKQGNIKRRKRFAFWPVQLTSGSWVWLEVYEQEYIWNGDEGWGWEKAGKWFI